jgi:hypothetical protein
MLCNSLMEIQNRMAAEKSIKYDPAKSVLKVAIGDEIRLCREDFVKWSDAFFNDLESKFLE